MVIMVNSQEAAGKEIFFFLVFSHFPNMSDLCAMDSVVQCALNTMLSMELGFAEMLKLAMRQPVMSSTWTWSSTEGREGNVGLEREGGLVCGGCCVPEMRDALTHHHPPSPHHTPSAPSQGPTCCVVCNPSASHTHGTISPQRWWQPSL